MQPFAFLQNQKISVSLSVALVLINVILSTQFALGSIILNPLIMIFLGQLLSRSHRDKSPLVLIAWFLGLILANEILLSLLYQSPKSEYIDLWIKISALVGLVPAIGMIIKTIRRNKTADSQVKAWSIVLTLLVPGIYFSAYFIYFW